MQQTRPVAHAIAEVTREIERRAQIDATTKQLLEFENHSAEADHAGRPPGFELNEHVDVTVSAKVGAQDAAVHGEPSHIVATAELRNRGLRKVDAVDQHAGILVIRGACSIMCAAIIDRAGRR